MAANPDEQRDIDDFIESVPEDFRDDTEVVPDTDEDEPFHFRVRGLWGLFFAFLFGAVFWFSFMIIGTSRSDAIPPTLGVAGLAFLAGFLLPNRILGRRSASWFPF